MGIIYEGHGTAMMLFYSVSFLYLFVSFRKMYLVAKVFKEKCPGRLKKARKQCREQPQSASEMVTFAKGHPTYGAITETRICVEKEQKNQDLAEAEDERPGSPTQAEEPKEDPGPLPQEEVMNGLDFCVILFEIVLAMPLLSFFLVSIAVGFTKLPFLQGTDNVITYIYNFGRIAFLFAIFLLTYMAIHQTSNSLVSENVMKFWKYFYDDSDKKNAQKLREDLDIESDADKANALSAALLFQLLQSPQGGGEEDHYKNLLLEVVGKKKASGNSVSGGGGGGGGGGGRVRVEGGSSYV